MREFPLPLANAADYPKPTILATASKHKFGLKSRTQSQFVAEGVYTKNGRAAIATVAQSLGLKAGDAILLPEFFCPAMIEPFIWLGLEVKFYQLLSTLELNQAHFEEQITENVKACLFVRYFGFSLDIKKSLLLAKKHDLLAIEDCAHSFFSKKTMLEEDGFDASICSLNKFFPCTDGGMYRLSSTNQLFPPVEPFGRDYKEEIKNILNFIGFDILLSKVKSLLLPSVKKTAETATEDKVNSQKPIFRYFHANDMQQCCFKLTEWLVNTSDYNKICKTRVDNFKLLYQELKNSPTGQPFIEFEQDAVPYVFPFLLNNSEDFHYIRSQGIQILRWEEFYQTSNNDFENYRTKLIQIPCHQGLTKKEISKIIAIINKENTSYVK